MKGSRCQSRIVALLLLLMTLASCAWSQVNTWTYKAHMQSARWNHAAATGPDGRIYVFGGRSGGGLISTLDSAEEYDPDNDTWTPIASLPEPRESFAAVTGPDGKIYIFGGQNNGGLVGTAFAYDATLDLYTPIQPPPVTGFCHGSLGNDGLIHTVFDREHYDYNPATDSWHDDGLIPSELGDLPVMASDATGLIYVTGGTNVNKPDISAFVLDPHTNAWTQLPDMATARREHGSAVGGDGRAYAFGGIGINFLSSFSNAEAYDPLTNSWSPIASLQISRTDPAYATDRKGNVYAIGGIFVHDPNPAEFLNTVERFEPPHIRTQSDDIFSVEGAVFNGKVGSFIHTDSSKSAINFTASIDWGDGTAPTVATIVAGGSSGHFDVNATHTYAEEGTYTTAITVSDADGETATATGKASVSDAPIHGTPQNFTAFAHVQFSGIIGSIVDDNPQAKASDYNVGLTWGDGSAFEALTVVTNGTPGGFNLLGTHTYLIPGTYTAHVELFDVGQFIAFDVIATVTPAPPTVTGHDFSATEGNKYIGQVAHFTDADPTLVAANFTATISWGDGSSTTSGSIVSDGIGGFNVNGSHTYVDEGDYIVHVTVTVVNGPSGSGDAEATIADAPLNATGFNLTCKGTNFSDTVAALTDGNPLAVASEFSAAIFWGDGKSSTGTVIKAGSGFKVTGKHSYLKKGKYTVTITIRDGGGSTASATTHINAGPVK